MVLWKKELDPFISVLPASSTSFLPILFHPPECIKSIHIAVYLPTLGLENKFVDELSKLATAINEIISAGPEIPIFLRGDLNVNQNNNIFG